MALTERYVTTTGAGAHDGTSEANAFSWTEMITDAASPAGKRYNIKKNATYSRTTTAESIGSGTATSPCILRGYNSTPGDGYLGRTNGNGPLITTNMPLIQYTTGRLSAGTFVIVESLEFNGAAATQGPFLGGASQVHIFSKHTNTVNGVNGIGLNLNAATNTLVANCDMAHTGTSGGAGLGGASAGCKIIGCRITSTTGEAIRVNNSNTTAIFLMNQLFVTGTVAINISVASAVGILFNTITGCTGNGITSVANAGVNIIWGNMITDNGGWAGDFGGAASAFLSAYNRTRDNTSGKFTNATDWIAATQWGDVTTDTGGASSDYVDSATQNYNLVATSPGVSAAFPLNASMGALQRSQIASLAPSPLISTLVQGNGPNK